MTYPRTKPEEGTQPFLSLSHCYRFIVTLPQVVLGHWLPTSSLNGGVEAAVIGFIQGWGLSGGRVERELRGGAGQRGGAAGRGGAGQRGGAGRRAGWRRALLPEP